MTGVDRNVGLKFGQSSSVSIQGSDSRHVVVISAGIPFNAQMSGQANSTKIPV